MGPRFGGVRSADTLPEIVVKPILFIVNTDDSDGKGLHWVAQYFPIEQPAEFFDSLGRHPARYGMETYLSDHIPSYLYNTK